MTSIAVPNLKNWKKAVAVSRGTGHLAKGMPCQDHALALVANGVACVALADGAGSCRLSDRGAAIVCEVICRQLTSRFAELQGLGDDELASLLLPEILAQLQSAADSLSARLTDFSATLLFSAVCGDRYLAGHLGDGVIGMRRGDTVCVLSEPYNGEYSNTTAFVTSADALQRFRIYRGQVDSGSGFVLMSDGAAFSLYDTGKKVFGGAVAAMLGWLEKYPEATVEEALHANLEEVLLPRTSDDCSIALLTRQAGVFEMLLAMSPEQQKKALGTRNSKALTVRLAVVEALSAKPDGMHENLLLAALGHLDGRRVRRQLAELRAKGIIRNDGGVVLLSNPA